MTSKTTAVSRSSRCVSDDQASNRRTFLRGLTTLPLIGGSVALLGSPTRAAEPVTEELLDSYSEWLYYERRLLCEER